MNNERLLKILLQPVITEKPASESPRATFTASS